MDEMKLFIKDFLLIIMCVALYFGVFYSIYLLSNMLLDTRFNLFNYSLFSAIAWSAYKIIR